jgi:hypothetical protein
MVEIVVSAFNATVTSLPAAVSAVDSAYATAEYEVNLGEFQDMFQIQCTDSLMDASTTPNIKYFVRPAVASTDFSFFSANVAKRINPALGKVVLNAATTVDSAGTALTGAQLSVVNDYMRDLAAKKMGSPHLSYLFTNDLVVQKSIVSKCAGVVDTIKGKLTALNSVDGSFALEPSDGNGKYLTDSTPGAENICRVLFQALFAQAPERFGLLVAGSAPGVEPVVAPTYFDATDPVDLPFQIGDSIVFNVVMDNSQQDATRGWATAGSISNRTYKIRLILKKYVLGASSAPANAIADTLAAGTFSDSLSSGPNAITLYLSGGALSRTSSTPTSVAQVSAKGGYFASFIRLMIHSITSGDWRLNIHATSSMTATITIQVSGNNLSSIDLIEVSVQVIQGLNSIVLPVIVTGEMRLRPDLQVGIVSSSPTSYLSGSDNLIIPVDTSISTIDATTIPFYLSQGFLWRGISSQFQRQIIAETPMIWKWSDNTIFPYVSGNWILNMQVELPSEGILTFSVQINMQLRDETKYTLASTSFNVTIPMNAFVIPVIISSSLSSMDIEQFELVLTSNQNTSYQERVDYLLTLMN